MAFLPTNHHIERAALPKFLEIEFKMSETARNFIPSIFRKLRDEYDKLEGALKKLGVDPECVVTEEEDGYNAESDLEDDTEQDCEREVETFVPAVYSVGGGAAHRPGRLLDRVEEVLPPSNNTNIKGCVQVLHQQIRGELGSKIRENLLTEYLNTP